MTVDSQVFPVVVDVVAVFILSCEHSFSVETFSPEFAFFHLSCKVSPETITVAARNEVLEQMDEPALDRNINLENLEETTVFQIKVRKPSEDAVLSNETITVTVEIEKEE